MGEGSTGMSINPPELSPGLVCGFKCYVWWNFMCGHVFLKILTKNLAGKNDESRMAQQKRLSRLDRGIQVFRFLQNEYKMFSHRTKPPSPTEYLPSSRGDGRPPSSIPRRRCGRRPLTESGGSPPARTTSWRRPSSVPLQWPSVTGTRAGTN